MWLFRRFIRKLAKGALSGCVIAEKKTKATNKKGN